MKETWPFWMGVILFLVLGVQAVGAIGHPPKRSYSLRDIGDLTPGYRIGFDPVGRLFVLQYDSLYVLNDNDWINLLEDGTGVEHTLTQVAFSEGGQAYYASHGHWGKLETTSQGLLRTVSLSPAERPAWTLSSDFEHIYTFEDNVVFYNWNGLVFYSEATGEHRYFEILGLDYVFHHEGEWYVSILMGGIRRLNLMEWTLEDRGFDAIYPRGRGQAFASSHNIAVFSHVERGFVVLKDSEVHPWNCGLDLEDAQNTRVMSMLPEGTIAVAVENKGVFLLSEEGEVLLELIGPEYHGVQQIIANEPGVLWYATDTGVNKVFHGSGVTVFDYRSGLALGWPEVAQWDDGVLVATNGRIFETVKDSTTGVTLFQPVPGQPDIHNLTVATVSDYMLVGNAMGVFGRSLDGSFETILSDMDVARIVVVDEDLCFVIGPNVITTLRRRDGKWVESSDRIRGFGFPAVTHIFGRSVWIELGLNRVVRLSRENGVLSAILLDRFPWGENVWVNAGAIGDIVVLSAVEHQRVYYDEKTQSFSKAPEIDRLLRLSPFPVWRVIKDDDSNIWLSHSRGLSRLRKTDGNYEFEMGPVRWIREPSPIMKVLEDGALWVSSRHSLYRVEPSMISAPGNRFRPLLMSVTDARTQEPVWLGSNEKDLGILNYDQNNLSFRFFAGTYTLDNLSYRVEMGSGLAQWSVAKTSSLLTITNIREGKYALKVSLMDAELPVGEPLILNFLIRPPWYRSKLAYGFYSLGVLAVVALLASVPVVFVKTRNRMLSRLVDERTRELEETMVRLKHEERNLAIHEERSRIAREIHDSVQQGLSGLKLILDATLKKRAISDELRSSLDRASKVLALTHQELKHVVWDMETPFLQSDNLRDSLEQVTMMIDSKTVNIEVHSIGTPLPLPASTNHHILRIVQESISNAIRHGDAGKIGITLSYGDDELELAIVDDGKGFSVEKATESPHQLGLRGILSRVERFNGVVSIDSDPGMGTVIRIGIPISGKENGEHHEE